MATSRRSAQSLATMLVLAGTLAMLLIGSADAWNQCPSGYADCKPGVRGCETCIAKDPNNCGKCGNICKQVANAVTDCKYGKCCEPVCKWGYGNCDGNIWDGCEKNLLSDPYNCGKCGYSCKQVPNAVTSCKNGKCGEPVCKPGYGNCDNNLWSNGCEKSLLSDPFNCGKCGYCCKQVPNAVTLCQSGKCGTPTCKPGYGNCDGNIWNGCEKSLLSDIYNCGKCGYHCPVTWKGAVATCSNGKCGQQCKSGYKYDNVNKCCVPKW